ncbi:hypothetical protein M422DRAFT_261786 [Sphaerobolus stellatus SS14]|uniref:Unplaced genomic scaffold SPHSTscaffold_109, whole genome shotgun sequence n=1 Tax=Sphaerobolus stellatus (strain SS14) TaxID=990650 RepID=A0A0C9TZJ6_SPHS4|nr:hypothetical protein M422DRAFT_261786 [Sphaerobolus stellatus SS14]
MLTESITRASKPSTSTAAGHITVVFTNLKPRDEDTDSYVSRLPPFTIPHLYTTLDITSPSIEDFPLSVKALLDIGSLSVMISSKLVDQLGLWFFDLPSEEDNLLLLLDTPLRCQEYVKMRVGLGQGAWKSSMFCAKLMLKAELLSTNTWDMIFIIYIHREDNTATDVLLRMPNNIPSAALAACTLAYTRNLPRTITIGILEISTNKEILTRILNDYQVDNFCKQVRADIEASSIEGVRRENKLLYLGKRLLIP